uniref:Neural cell adhesion molecule L1-like protein n=1 Tax=Anas platyrhynchos TaxID=8839 RepID=A0A8B9TND2_ANAPL
MAALCTIPLLLFIYYLFIFIFPVLTLQCWNDTYQCFNWTKDGKPFNLLSDPRIITFNNSGTFVIQNHGIISNFQGKYRCYASNALGTAMSEEIELIVPSVPKFPKEKIEPLDVEHGDSVILHCNPPKGIPPLHIYWMNIDLQHIPQDERVSMSLKGDLYFANVEENDSRSDYCCFAAFPRLRTIVQKMPMTLKVSRCKSVAGLFLAFCFSFLAPQATVNADVCPVSLIPTPHLSWVKVTGNLPKDKSVKENFGKILKIEQVSAADEGTYQCTASNPMGRTKHEFHVHVEEPPRWIKEPEGGVYSVGTNLVLLCEAIGNPEPTIQWKLNGMPIDSKYKVLQPSLGGGWIGCVCVVPLECTKSLMIIVDMDTLFISSVTLEDQGVYMCVASTSLDSVVAESRLIVLDVPDPPEDLQLSEHQNRSVRLSWKAGASHNSPVNESIIEYEESQWEPGRWQELTQVPGNDTTALLTLAPYMNYQFRVVSVNAVGRSQPSKPSLRYATPPAAPDKNPENIRVEASEPNEMVMKWEPLKPTERNGPGLEYKVSWRQRGVETDWNEELVKKHSLTLRNTPTFVPYEIKVQAVNNLGTGPEPNVTTGYSGEDTPDAAPSGVSVDIVNSTLVKVFWFGIPRDRVRGHLKGYKVSWWKTKSMLDGKRHHPEKHHLTFVGDRNYGMIPGLEPFSEFRLTVVAYNSKGDGPESSPVVFETPEGVPEQPRFLKILNFDKDSVTLSWGLPKKANGHLTGYILQYQIINETHEIGPLSDISVANRSTLSWRLSGLSASTKYKFYVKACTAKGCGNPVTEEGLTMAQGSKLIAYAGIYDGISTQGWFIGLMCAVALLTLLLLTICFVRRNKGGKYSVKEKEDLHPDPEAQSIKDEIFGEYSDSDEKPLKGSLRSINGDIKATESADSLVDYGEGEHGMFNEDGSFIGAYSGSKEKGSVESTGSSTATFPLHA